MIPCITTVIFDLGGVLVDWDPRYLYRDFFRDDERMEQFLRDVCSIPWIREMDAGKSFAQAIAERTQAHPAHATALALWGTHWGATIRGSLPETVEILNELKAGPRRLLALTNWAAETFPYARQRFDFFAHFEDILVSGEHGVLKPDRAIFDLACSRWRIQPEQCVFIDDSLVNVESATALGFHGIHFTAPSALRARLHDLQILP